MSSVLLGVCDAEISSSTCDFKTNKIGGKPDIRSTFKEPSCKLCSKSLNFVTQIYCPLDESIYHRTMYLFACGQPTCQNKSESWCVLRNQQKDESCKAIPRITEKEEDVFAVDDDWGSDDGWGDDIDLGGQSTKETKEQAADPAQLHSEGKTESESLDAAAEKMKQMCVDDIDSGSDMESANNVIPENISEVQHPKEIFCCVKSAPSEDTVEFVPHYINVLEEPESETSVLDHAKHLMRDYAVREGVNLQAMEETMMEGGGGKDKEKYEKSAAQHGDVAFEKFKKRVARMPLQILRYNWQGSPLHISQTSNVKPPSCKSCGGPSVFELQLMPSLVSILKTRQGDGEILDFGTVLVFSCMGSCWSEGDNLKEEYVILETDPDLKLFKERAAAC